MHNGDISDFISIKRDLCNLLDEDIYSWIKGQTDSEHLFALFLQLGKNKDLSTLSVVAEVLEATFDTIDQLLVRAGKVNRSFLNVCLTDGKRLIASRYCVDKKAEPESLHYLPDPYYSPKQRAKVRPPECVLIASEMLTNIKQWISVPRSHFVCVDEDYTVKLKPIVTCEDSKG